MTLPREIIIHEALLRSEARVAEAEAVIRALGRFPIIATGRQFSLDPAVGDVVLSTLQHARRILDRKTGGPGFWYRPEVMKVSAWSARYQDHMLNEGVFVPWAAVRNRSRVLSSVATGGSVFVRPDGGNKSFPGQVINLFDLAGAPCINGTEQMDALEQIHHVQPDDMVYVAPAAEIEPVEWRFWVVNREVAAWSPYAWEGEPTWARPPAEVLKLARDLAAHPWQPDIAWVADICVRRGNAFLLEVNAASTSGLYDAPLKPLLIALIDAAEAELAGDLTLEG